MANLEPNLEPIEVYPINWCVVPVKTVPNLIVAGLRWRKFRDYLCNHIVVIARHSFVRHFRGFCFSKCSSEYFQIPSGSRVMTLHEMRCQLSLSADSIFSNCDTVSDRCVDTFNKNIFHGTLMVDVCDHARYCN